MTCPCDLCHTQTQTKTRIIRSFVFLFVYFFLLRMFRLQWHLLADKKPIWVALTAVYGIGISKSKQLLKKLEIAPEKKVAELTDQEQKSLSEELKLMVLENDLRRQVASDIKRLKEIKCYRGIRHNLWLPVRGQQTRRHAKTAKKLLWRDRVRPVLKVATV